MHFDPNSTPEQRKYAAIEHHKKQQLSEHAFSVMLPVRGSLHAVVKAFFNEAKRTASVPYYINTLRNLLVWAEVNSGRSDDQILDAIEDELDKVHAKKAEYAAQNGTSAVRSTEDDAS
jgi:hypothetical protein